mgnify:CR=1 FL=1
MVQGDYLNRIDPGIGSIKKVKVKVQLDFFSHGIKECEGRDENWN